MKAIITVVQINIIAVVQINFILRSITVSLIFEEIKIDKKKRVS